MMSLLKSLCIAFLIYLAGIALIAMLVMPDLPGT